jgi:ribosomal protein S18 acetylase RimI-like enzyme
VVCDDGGVAGHGTRVWVAGEDELDEVAQLISEFRDHWGNAEPPLETIRRRAKDVFAEGGEYLLGAGGEGDAPAGFVQLRYRASVWSAGDCWLEDLFVRESARRSGLGRALVETSIERARARGCERIELDTNEDNDAALALYDAAGFSVRSKARSRSLFLGRRL